MDMQLATVEPETPTESRRLTHTGVIGEVVGIRRLLIARMSDPKVKDGALSALVRSYCLVCETLRVWKGIPAPGQLRPDLDPVQLQRAIKRARARRPLDIGHAVQQAIISETEAETTDAKSPQPTTPQAAEATEPPKTQG